VTPAGEHLVLIAEDDPSVLMTLEWILGDEGFGVVTARDGREAMQLATARRPDVILLDQVMPKMTGKEVLSALRKDDATRDIPVFVLTGMTPDDQDDWVGAHFIAKPFSPDDLVKRIRRVLESGARSA
jgi:DNA-binding response OmpR family regulator